MNNKNKISALIFVAVFSAGIIAVCKSIIVGNVAVFFAGVICIAVSPVPVLTMSQNR
jgi:hypothetical protein